MDRVEIPKSHKNEWKSQRDLEAILVDEMNMYLPTGWTIRDYGIDAFVEFMTNIRNSDSTSPTGMYFTVQLKAAENPRKNKAYISYPIPVRKIIQWYRSNLACLFILYNLSDQTFYFLWIDDDLISFLETRNDTWATRKSTTIRIPLENVFAAKQADEIRNYVTYWKPSIRNIVKPGTYFKLKDSCALLLEKYREITAPFKLDSIDNSIDLLAKELDRAIYRISITGPSRAGKSTLTNALLRRADISPTGVFQTTGVPIQILPAKEEKVKILFKDNSVVKENLTSDVIKKYASQDENEDNQKGVKIVTIHVANKQLEQGISFFDIPGLDDPDEQIYEYAWRTVIKSNAIIYMIDASSAAHGGFIFRKEYKEQILELGTSLDKIFLVFNKINALNIEQLEALQERVKKDLQKHKLYESIAEKIYYISAEESLNIRNNKQNGSDSVQALENDIWQYLLGANKIGLTRLRKVCYEISTSMGDFEGLLRTRLLDNENQQKVTKVIESAKKRISNLNERYANSKAEIEKSLRQSLEVKKNHILENLEKWLKSTKIHEQLPSKKSIRKYLMDGANNTLSQTNQEFSYHMELLQRQMNDWIEDILKEVKNLVVSGSQKRQIDFSVLANIDLPGEDLTSSFGIGLFTGFIGFLASPALGIVAALAAFAGSLVLSTAERQAKQINKTMEQSKRHYNDLFKKIAVEYINLVNDYSREIIKNANEEIHIYFKDLKKQMGDLGPLTDKDLLHYEAVFKKIEALSKENKALDEETYSFYSGV